ncbi:MAG: DUF2490 domain-containing protein [Bacteroidales bacterium]|nr:DUF2490 domain-containing protein [Bacteroidales bacterium]MDD6621314.1 DUF2490 domain-containing protein [Bacteroidales bacterium]
MKLSKRLAVACLIASALAPTVQAADNDFGMWYSVSAEKKITKKWSAEIEAEMRTRNDARTWDRWSASASAKYKLTKWLNAEVAYVFLNDNNPEKISYHTNGDYNNWRPSYWGTRHRFNVSLTGKVGFGGFEVSLRERWQYTYRPEATTLRYDFDNSEWEDVAVRGKGSNVLRSRLQVEYNIPKSKVDPHASVELFNAWNVEKVRYTVGADWKIRKKHVIGVNYIYQSINGDDVDNDPNSNIVSLSYKFKF